MTNKVDLKSMSKLDLASHFAEGLKYCQTLDQLEDYGKNVVANHIDKVPEFRDWLRSEFLARKAQIKQDKKHKPEE